MCGSVYILSNRDHESRSRRFHFGWRDVSFQVANLAAWSILALVEGALTIPTSFALLVSLSLAGLLFSALKGLREGR